MIKMKQQNLKQLFVFLLLFLPVMAFSQSNADSLKQKHSESVTIYGTSRPVIRQAFKINSKPQLLVFKTQPTNVLFNLSENAFPTIIQLKAIKPASIHIGGREKIWGNFLKLGIGSRISPYAEFFHSAGKENSYQFNVHLKHFSSFKNLKNYLPSPYSHSLAELSFDKYFRYHILSFAASYDLRTNRYYGHNTALDTLVLNKKDTLLRQTYQKATVAIDFSSIYKNFDKLHQSISLGSTYFIDRYGTSEWLARLGLDVHKAFRVSNIFDHQQLGLEGGYKYYKNQTKYNSEVDHFARIMPYFDARYGLLSFKTGINLEWLKQSQGVLHFYPYLSFKVTLLPQSLSFFGGWNGGLEKNSRVKLTEENPFLNSFQNNYQWQNTRWKFYAGLQGNIAKRLGFEFRASRSSFRNMALFDYPYLLWLAMPTFYPTAYEAYYLPYKNEFSIIYTNGKVWDFSGSLSWSNSTTLKLWLKGAYHQYQLDYGQKPYYKPLQSVSLGASFRVNDKIKPWFEVYYEGKRWARSPSYFIGNLNGNVYQMEPYVDINLGLDYQLNKQSYVFGKITNLLNKHYYRFNEYPVMGFEVMLGVSYRF